jgi:hypothetical protein
MRSSAERGQIAFEHLVAREEIGRRRRREVADAGTPSRTAIMAEPILSEHQVFT